jgi:hypothetical protein
MWEARSYEEACRRRADIREVRCPDTARAREQRHREKERHSPRSEDRLAEEDRERLQKEGNQTTAADTAILTADKQHQKEEDRHHLPVEDTRTWAGLREDSSTVAGNQTAADSRIAVDNQKREEGRP